MSDQRRYEAYLRLDTALLHDPAAGAHGPAAGWRLRELAERLLSVRDDGRELVQEAAALLSGLVAAGTLSDETADLRLRLLEPALELDVSRHGPPDGLVRDARAQTIRPRANRERPQETRVRAGFVLPASRSVAE